eukprot:1143202-Pelagomonas_calceolata.AAC.10
MATSVSQQGQDGLVIVHGDICVSTRTGWPGHCCGGQEPSPDIHPAVSLHFIVSLGVLTVHVIRCINLKGDRPTTYVDVLLKQEDLKEKEGKKYQLNMKSRTR